MFTIGLILLIQGTVLLSRDGNLLQDSLALMIISVGAGMFQTWLERYLKR